MATLTNPITPQNIVDRFADYALATANAGIVWGTDSLPFGEMSVGEFGGSTGGRGITTSGGNIGSTGSLITASTIYNTLVNETATYTNIRNLRAVLFVDSTPPVAGLYNTGTRPTPGIVYDQTQVAHLNTGYRQSIGSPSPSNVSAGNNITAAGLEQFFDNLRTSYNSARGNIQTIQTNVCHASCHSACHISRARR